MKRKLINEIILQLFNFSHSLLHPECWPQFFTGKTKTKLLVQNSSGDTPWNVAFCKSYILTGRIMTENSFPFWKQDNLKEKKKFSKQQTQNKTKSLKLLWYWIFVKLFISSSYRGFRGNVSPLQHWPVSQYVFCLKE